jgi:hypothetical protein
LRTATPQRCASGHQQRVADVFIAAMLTAPLSFGTWACGARRTRTGALSSAASLARNAVASALRAARSTTAACCAHACIRAACVASAPQSALRFVGRPRRWRRAWRGRRFAHAGPRRHAEALAGACAAMRSHFQRRR